MAQETVQHLGLNLPGINRPVTPPATQGAAPRQEPAEPQPGADDAQPQQRDNMAEVIQQRDAEIRRLQALLAQATADAQALEGRNPPPGEANEPRQLPQGAIQRPAAPDGLPQLFTNDDAAALARALAVSATGAGSDASKGVTLPAIIPGHKVNPLKLGEYSSPYRSVRPTASIGLPCYPLLVAGMRLASRLVIPCLRAVSLKPLLGDLSSRSLPTWVMQNVSAAMFTIMAYPLLRSHIMLPPSNHFF
jgi:hypothetical protein